MQVVDDISKEKNQACIYMFGKNFSRNPKQIQL